MRKKFLASIIILLLCALMGACTNANEEIDSIHETIDDNNSRNKTEYGDVQNTIEADNCIENSEQTAGNDNDQIGGYLNVIRNLLSEGKTNFAVSFISLNDDEVKEMVIILGDAKADGGYIYALKDGEAILISNESGDCFGQYGSFSYLEKENVFIGEYESITDDGISHSISYYTMENNNAIWKDTAKSITVFDSDDISYFINNERVEQSEYESIEEKYMLKKMITIGYQDGVHVVDDNFEDMIYEAYSGTAKYKIKL